MNEFKIFYLKRKKMASDTNSEITRSGFQSSLQACLHLMPDWIHRVREDYKEEDNDKCSVDCCGNLGWPLQLIEKQGRIAVWNVTRDLEVHASGVAALACRLMERYLCAQLRRTNITPAESLELQRFLNGLSARIPILIATCVQIAAKSISATICLSAKQVCTYLNRKGAKHSVKDIVAWEYHVFQTIGYRVPLWTSVEMAELLATRARLAPAARRALPALVHVAELRRDAVDERVRWAADLSPDSSGSLGSGGARPLCVRTLHLAAGAVAACARYGAPPAPGLERRLAAAAGAPRAFLECVRDAILTVAVEHGGAKRRRVD